MRKLIRNVLLYLLLLLLPFVGLVFLGERSADPFENVFTAALSDKAERLRSVEGQKIVFVGGSSLPFGLRCDLIEELFSAEAVDMGTYAALGTRATAEVALCGISAGDIVVLAPELDRQTYSCFFDADTMWEAASGDRSLISCLSLGEQTQMLLHYPLYLITRIRNADTSVPDGTLYARSSFNRYGDIDYQREGNRMSGGYDAGKPVSLDGLTDAEFFSFVNRYADEITRRGAVLYVTFPPVDRSGAAFDESESHAFAQKLSASLSCPVLGEPSEFLYDEGYFYDTNFHLNEAGAVMHTVHVARLLADALGVSVATDEIDVPAPPTEETKETEKMPQDANAAYFSYEDIGGNRYLASVKEAYRAKESLTLPTAIDGERVVGIRAGCFAGCDRLKRILVPSGYRSFDMGAFAGCACLAEIYLSETDPGKLAIPSSGLFDGTGKEIRMLVPRPAYAAYVGSYSFRVYREFLSAYDEWQDA